MATSRESISSKTDSEKRVEDLEQAATPGTFLDKDQEVVLSEAHREYLISRHGTVELDPLPSMSDADPYNWPHWKKVINLALVAFHAMMATFIAAGINSAFPDIAKDLGVTIHRTTYLTSLQIAILGGAPLFWRPLSNRYGRRPIFILSLIGSLLFNLGCAKSETYAVMATCRAFTAFFISPASAIGSAVVVETFFKKDRAKYMGVWTLLLTLGVPLAPFIFGFVAYHVGYRWIYWIFAMINGAQLILYIFFGPETRYIREGVDHSGPAIKESYFKFGRIDPTPLSAWEFISPLNFAKYPTVMITAAGYSMVFLFANILITVEIPTLFGEKFDFNTQQLGLQFLGTIIGSLIGEQIGGWASDAWMNRGVSKIGARPAPEYRLWLSYLGYLLSICGVIVFLVRIDQAPEGQWNVTPIVGAGIAAAGNQIVTTIIITYCVDCYHEEAASIGVFITFVRQIWGFLGPFWFPDMFTNVGVAESAGIATACLVAVSLLPTMYVQWKGQALRR